MTYRDWISEIERINYKFFGDLKACTHACNGTPNPYHLEHDGNVWGHTLDVYKQSRELYPEDEILQLACLLHDIAKPNARFEEDNKAKFFNHEGWGVSVAAEILIDLNITLQEKRRVLELIQRHADSYKLGLKKLRAWYNKEELLDIIKIRWCDTLGREKQDDGKDIQQIKDLALELNNFVDYFNNYSNGSPECTILIGPPNSGKSTWVKNNGIENVLSRDSIIMELGNSENYNENWDNIDQKEVDTLFKERRQSFINKKESFVIDMTNMNAKSRNRQIHDIKRHYNLKAVVFITGYSTLLERNQNRENKVLGVSVIESMVKRWQLPFYGEGFYDVDYIFN